MKETKYVTIKVTREVLEVLKVAQYGSEPISETIRRIVDPVKVIERQRLKEREARR